MDLHTVTGIARPTDRASLPPHGAGDAFLAGGTWLFSEPQPALRRLVDLGGFGWTPLAIEPDGLRIAATCTMAALEAASLPPAWTAGTLLAESCAALWGSFKIQKAATVGGNLCLSLPAAPMAALAVALSGICHIWTIDGGTRRLDARDFITGAGRNVLGPGEILREITLPAGALACRAVLRQASLTADGRSGALVVGTRARGAPGLALTVTASVQRPVRIVFDTPPDRIALAASLDAAIPAPLLHDDVHGTPLWRRHMTHLLAREIVDTLA